MHVLYEEDRVIVARKPEGLTSEELSRQLDLKLVHRIDRATSGLIMLARDARTVTRMQRALQRGEVERIYRFIAHGDVKPGLRESFLVRDRGDGRRGSAPGGKRAIAALFDWTFLGEVTLGFARLVTGRTHQIRIQLAEEGHPIVGERVYAKSLSPRLMLHSERLRFTHPSTKQLVDLHCVADFEHASIDATALGK